MRQILYLGGTGVMIFLFVNQCANVDQISVHKPAGTMLPQFSWKRQNGEVVELKDFMDRKADGTIISSKQSWWNALMKTRPELGREFGMDTAIRNLRMDDTVAQMDQHFRGEKIEPIDTTKWWWRK